MNAASKGSQAECIGPLTRGLTYLQPVPAPHADGLGLHVRKVGARVGTAVPLRVSPRGALRWDPLPTWHPLLGAGRGAGQTRPQGRLAPPRTCLCSPEGGFASCGACTAGNRWEEPRRTHVWRHDRPTRWHRTAFPPGPAPSPVPLCPQCRREAVQVSRLVPFLRMWPCCHQVGIGQEIKIRIFPRTAKPPGAREVTSRTRGTSPARLRLPSRFPRSRVRKRSANHRAQLVWQRRG